MAYKKFTASEDMLKPDPRFNSKLVSKFINCLMWQGKKTVAMKCFYGAMEQIAKKNKDKEGAPPPLEVFETAINNVKPYVEVRSKRVGGANYQVPMQVNKRRQQSLAFRWIIHACRVAFRPKLAERLNLLALVLGTDLHNLDGVVVAAEAVDTDHDPPAH